MKSHYIEKNKVEIKYFLDIVPGMNYLMVFKEGDNFYQRRFHQHG